MISSSGLPSPDCRRKLSAARSSAPTGGVERNLSDRRLFPNRNFPNNPPVVLLANADAPQPSAFAILCPAMPHFQPRISGEFLRTLLALEAFLETSHRLETTDRFDATDSVLCRFVAPRTPRIGAASGRRRPSWRRRWPTRWRRS